MARSLRAFLGLIVLSALLGVQALELEEKYGFPQLRETAKRIEDLVAQETKTGESKIIVDSPDRSREELEPQKPEDKVVDADASAADDSVEKEPKNPKSDDPKPSSPDDSDYSDEDDDDFPAGAFPSLGGLHNIFNFLRQPALKPWWQGPNVCIERDVSVEDAPDSKTSASGDGFLVFGVGISQFSSCKHSPSKYVCTTVTTKDGTTSKSTVTYQCCHGSRRVSGKEGCQKVDTKSVMEAAKEIGCDRFERAVESEGIADLLSGNKTIFMPIDSAFLSFRMDDSSSNNVLTNEVAPKDEKSVPSKMNVLLNHIVPGVYEMADLENEMLLMTEDNQTLRVNGYPGGIRTVNCAVINTTDTLTHDGVIHTIEKVLLPVTQSLADILEEERFSKFKQLLIDNKLWEPLKGGKTATVFALTNEQVDLLEPKHAMCMQTILRHHILPHTVCSAAVNGGRISSIDLATNWVHMEKSEGGNLVLDKTSKVTEGDKMATNGVLHVVDSFMVPSSARSVTELLRQTNRTRFLSLLEKANLKKEVDKSSDITLFVPVDAKLEDLEKLDAEELRNTLLFHVATGKFESDDLDNGVMIPTKDGEEKIRVTAKANVLSALMGKDNLLSVQCVPLTRVDGRICNGIAHEVAQPLKPATSSVLEIIENDARLSLFKDALKDTELEKELKEGSLGGPVTVLAPTNDAFKNLRAATLEKIATNKEAADAFLRAHVLTDALCCSNVGPSSWPFVSTVRTLAGAALPLGRRSSSATFGGVDVETCDLTARDGIVHVLDGVLESNKRRNNPFHEEEIFISKPNSDIILAGL